MFRGIAALLLGLLLCAQSPIVPGFPPGTFQNRAALDATPAGGSVSFTYTGGQADTSSGGLTQVDFNSLSVSAGYNVVAFAPAVGGPVTSMLICGTTATFLGTATGDASTIEMWGASVSGGTCQVRVNLTSSSFGSCMAYGVLSGANTTPAATAVLTSPTTFASSQGTTTGLTLAAGDLGLVALDWQNSFANPTWSSATLVGTVTNSRPAQISMATMSASGTPTVTNQSGQIGSILALKFTP